MQASRRQAAADNKNAGRKRADMRKHAGKQTAGSRQQRMTRMQAGREQISGSKIERHPCENREERNRTHTRYRKNYA
jgi:hypothetical protein